MAANLHSGPNYNKICRHLLAVEGTAGINRNGGEAAERIAHQEAIGIPLLLLTQRNADQVAGQVLAGLLMQLAGPDAAFP